MVESWIEKNKICTPRPRFLDYNGKWSSWWMGWGLSKWQSHLSRRLSEIFQKTVSIQGFTGLFENVTIWSLFFQECLIFEIFICFNKGGARHNLSELYQRRKRTTCLPPFTSRWGTWRIWSKYSICKDSGRLGSWKEMGRSLSKLCCSRRLQDTAE